MVLMLATVVGAVMVGYVRGGRLRNLAQADLRASWLVLAAVGAQGVLEIVSAQGGPVHVLGPVLLGLSQIAVLGFVWANRLLPGMLLVLIGLALNALVITANGAMPVAPEALAAITAGEQQEIARGKHQLLEEGDPFPYLADILPLAPLRTVVSVGDVVLAAGVGILVMRLMRPRTRARAPTS